MKDIPVFAINLNKRLDRKNHIINQFDSREEFELKIITAIEHDIGAIGLWKTMRKIVLQAKISQQKYIIICEDDHTFTVSYVKNVLFEAIKKGEGLCADLLLGGISHFDDAVEFDKGIFWINGFTGTQFFVMFQRFYDIFLNLRLNSHDNIDLSMSSVSTNIYCMYPFISVQREFGYSDITKKNEKLGVVDEYFIKSERRLKTLSFLKELFK
ncbi:hypothetical protein [Sphingobacterium sp. GVS05A]|uniref:hypothetical protein n=1 Tax=Sphingobacterium sp. GVS05A TaxID=2862679 RepID=UPI001CC10AE3|nr:hypothetical protein [Sphingobacterium sp. GVS05A]